MSVYTTPVFLSANAPKQKSCATPSSCLGGPAGTHGGLAFGVVDRSPCRGRFMCPFAVAGAGGKYFIIALTDKCDASSRRLSLAAWRSVDCLGLAAHALVHVFDGVLLGLGGVHALCCLGDCELSCL